MVSHTSENREPGSMLVTRIGTLTGTLELRRRLSGEYEFCIVRLFRRNFAALSSFCEAPLRTTLPLICQSRSNQRCHWQAVFGNRAQVGSPGGSTKTVERPESDVGLERLQEFDDGFLVVPFQFLELLTYMARFALMPQDSVA